MPKRPSQALKAAQTERLSKIAVESDLVRLTLNRRMWVRNSKLKSNSHISHPNMRIILFFFNGKVATPQLQLLLLLYNEFCAFGDGGILNRIFLECELIH